MSSARTAWHPLFASLLTERAPPSFEVRSEVLLSNEPQRADLLLLRRHGMRALDAQAQVLRQLWSSIEREALVEFKSRARPLRRHDLSRLLGYGWPHFAGRSVALFRPQHLQLVLIVPTPSPTLHKEVARLGFPPLQFHRGYALLDATTFPTVVIRLDDVADEEKDDLLALFVRAKLQSAIAARWLGEHGMSAKPSQIEHLEGYDEIQRVFLESLPFEVRLDGIAPEQRLAGLAPEQRLAGLAPEQRLAGLAPEQRLAGLAPEQRLSALSLEEHLLALPVEALRALDRAYVANLPESVRRVIQKRIQER